ncbi:MAG: universal stress protein [Flavobacteriales bacterium]|nr:universal stress protein [Flavobacteriales bacterium]
MKHILIPTDFSDGSMAAVRFAFDAFGTTGTHYILLHTIGDIVPSETLPEYVPMLLQTGKKELHAFSEKCRALKPEDTIELTTVVDSGAVFFAIERVYEAQPVDAVVLGAKGKGAATFWGTQTTDVVKMSTRPVVVVPVEWQPGPIQRILYADDRIHIRKRNTLSILVDLAKRYGSEIALVHVRVDQDEPLAPSSLDKKSAWFQDVAHTSTTIAAKDVQMGLEQLAGTGDYGMLAVLHHHVGWFDMIFHRSLAKKLALHTTLPLLVLYE